jgi:hypothetical protein
MIALLFAINFRAVSYFAPLVIRVFKQLPSNLPREIGVENTQAAR